MKSIDVNELKRLLSNKPRPTVINTLPPDSFIATRIPHSINIPQDQPYFAERVEKELGDRSERVVVYCASQECNSSTKAAQKLDAAGFSQVYDFEGGAKGWEAAGEKLASSEA